MTSQTFAKNPLPLGYTLSFNPEIGCWVMKTPRGSRLEFEKGTTHRSALKQVFEYAKANEGR